MTTERQELINEWLKVHCQTCANNDDRETEFVNCQAECEVRKGVGVACIHFENAEWEDDYGYERASDMRDYCERYEPTYNPEDGSM